MPQLYIKSQVSIRGKQNNISTYVRSLYNLTTDTWSHCFPRLESATFIISILNHNRNMHLSIIFIWANFPNFLILKLSELL